MRIRIVEGCDKLGKSTVINNLKTCDLNYYIIKSPNRSHFSKEFVDFYMKSDSRCTLAERQYYFTTDEQLEFLLLSQEMLRRQRNNLPEISTVFFDRLNIISSYIYRPPKSYADKVRFGLAQNVFLNCLSAFKKDIESIHLDIFYGENPLIPLDTSEEMEKNWHKKNKRYLKYYYEDNTLLNICNKLGIKFSKLLSKVD